MNIRGWVYVFSNKAMQGRVKIGFSTKDPNLRIRELDGTGLPHPFIVEYDVLVVEPRQIEQAVHKRLSAHHDAKEFFLISPHDAAMEIRSAIKEQNREIIAEQVNFQSISGICMNSYGTSGYSACKICKYPLARTDTRCPKCFALT